MKHRTGYLHKRGDNFYVSWRVNGKLFSKALRDDNGQPITTRREAEEVKGRFMAPFAVANEAEVLASIVSNLEGRKAGLAKWDDEHNPPMTLDQTWSAYVASSTRPDTGPDTLAVYAGQFGQFKDWMKQKHPGVIALRGVNPEIAEEYANHLNHGRLAPGTFNKHVRVLTLVFRVLFKKAKLTTNPWLDIQRKRVISHTRRELTVDELRRVCQSTTGEMKTLFALGIYTGLRLRDCATLLWGEVDLQRGIIRRVPNKIARNPNARPVMVPIHAALKSMLIETPAEARSGYVLQQSAETYLTRKKNLINSIQKLFTDSKIEVHKPGTGVKGTRAVVEVGFHSLRHSFVSICRANNVPLSVVEALVGHSNPAMTRHYTHTSELAASNAIALLPAVIGEGESKANCSPSNQDGISKALDVAKSLNGKNWKEKKATLLSLLDINRELNPVRSGNLTSRSDSPHGARDARELKHS